jgi:hypothetical protein
MSTGGIFKLITNDGKQDKLLMATELLIERLKSINATNEFKGWSGSWNADLHNLEKTHTMFVSGVYKPFATCGHEYIKVPVTEGSPSFNTRVRFKIPQIGDFYSDMVVHVRINGLRAVNAADKVRFVSFPGHRLFKKTSFSINNNPLDSYSGENYNKYYQFKVPEASKVGWKRNMGEEIPYVGHVTPDPLVDEFREYRWIGSGNQTFKYRHDSIDLWIPLLFWFKQFNQSLPSIAVPYGKTFVDIELAKVAEIVSFADYGGGGAYVEPTIERCDLYVNNLFILPELQDIFLRKIGFTLIRVHLEHKETLSIGNHSVRLNQLKWPIETLYMCFRPQVNSTTSQGWAKCTSLAIVDRPTPVASGAPVTTFTNNIRYFSETPVISRLELSAHDIPIYKDFPAQFFNSYIPLRFGKNINTPEDQGWYMMNFNLWPGERYPTGHINISRAREFYLSYTSDVITNTNKADLVVLADAINFLLVADGTAVLRFST